MCTYKESILKSFNVRGGLIIMYEVIQNIRRTLGLLGSVSTRGVGLNVY